MTASELKRDLSSQIWGFAFSGALHVAAGLALFYTSDKTASSRDRISGGEVLVLELTAFDGVGRTPQSSMINEKRRVSKRIDAPPPPPNREGAPASLAGPQVAHVTNADSAIPSDRPGDARTMADLPNSEVMAYRQQLENHLARFRTYPLTARAAGRQGVVTVSFTMTRDGRVLDAWAETSSGVSELDEEAMAAILRAQPLPAYPSNWPGRLPVSLPIAFRLG